MTGVPVPHPVEVPPPDIARWRDGNTGVPFVHEADSGVPGPDVLLTALVHGNEYSGAIVLDQLLAAQARPASGRWTLAFCNTEAFATFDAAAPDASRFLDEDFNRVWSPARLAAAPTSREAARARALRPFVDRCTHLLDLHSMHEPAPPLIVTGLLARNIAFARSLRCPAQAVADEGHADGMRMRDYDGGGDRGHARIALLLEAGQHWAHASVATAQDMTARFLVAAGSLGRGDVPPGWLQPDGPVQPLVRVTHRVVARTDGFRFTADFRGGEVIALAGTPVAVDGHDTIRTPHDRCVLVMPSVRQLRPGVTTVRFGMLET